MLKRTLLFLACSVSFFGCKQHRLDQVKNFHIFVETKEPTLKNAVIVLTEDYNSRIGYQALSVVDSKEESNSVIHFQDGLINDGHKLGLGQWVIVKNVSSTGVIEKTDTTTLEYGMDIIFDFGNFESKSAFIDDTNSDQYKHLFHLFAHEVGHGMQMDHATDLSSVMYPSIPEKQVRTIDYAQYFASIRNFMEHPSTKAAQNHDHDHNHNNKNHEAVVLAP